MKEHLLPVCEVLSYCLMPNHFHLIIRFNETETVKQFFKSKKTGKLSIDELIQQNENYLGKELSQVCSNFFNTYSKHYNFVKSRTGTLFKRTFRRKVIDDLDYLKTLICYIHQNPVASGFAENISQWKYSSYNAIIGTQPTLVKRAFIISLFDDLENYKYCHLKDIELEID
ncbi:MAG TPA: hypothetical protein VJY62_04705 [Bacteroidia bacterium]|nr:hypothetical protein [Bacteroidia bacterium]